MNVLVETLFPERECYFEGFGFSGRSCLFVWGFSFVFILFGLFLFFFIYFLTTDNEIKASSNVRNSNNRKHLSCFFCFFSP